MMSNSSTVNHTLTNLFDKVWGSLDDILACVGVFLVARIFANSLHWCAKSYFKLSVYSAQALHFGFIFVVFMFLISHLIGATTAVSLFSGFSIGFGYAMQPYIMSLLAGATFRSTDMFRKGDTVNILNNTYVLRHIGLLYVCVEKGDFITYFPNSTLSSSAVGIRKRV
jgi:small-conductance mechanosensitive channel